MRGRGRPSYHSEDAEAADRFHRATASLSLDRADAAPLWVQLKNELGGAIASGALPAGTRLPSEQAMCALLQVSRPVVRAAISALAGEGLILKMPRTGMFVAEKARETDFLAMPIGVFENMRAKGHRVDTTTYEYRLHDANTREREVFGLPERAKVLRIVRVYRLDGQPLTLTHISLPAHRVPGMESLEIGNQSVFETIRARYGLTVQRADRWFTAEIPDPDAAVLLELAHGSPAIRVESIAYDHDGVALEYYWAYYNSQTARVHIAVNPV
ncbi:GntR family transcriptional regulator [Falsirhodobacter halotolerans]|uniref:GntR family transcriptional regulator n=1 Tax=Falsirhodobacter halotolerans TaxID=1146892 RepID=UPI001FD0FCD1|nr:GntR family transcriptional regulator [Falsirhodobacter halotolerans]MCJ8139146.1 GntR family transcriptional regulator [Falsirhodobacter halotolerans]